MPDVAGVRPEFVQTKGYELARQAVFLAFHLVLFPNRQLTIRSPGPYIPFKRESSGAQEHEWQRMSWDVRKLNQTIAGEQH